MVAFVIFWSATCAVLFFALGVIFKALASALDALFFSICRILSYAGRVILVEILLFMLIVIVDGDVKKGVESVVGFLITLVVMLGLFGGLGAALLKLILNVVVGILLRISDTLESLADKCERGYIKFLKVMINRIDKC